MEGLCTHNFASDIYEKLEAELSAHLKTQLTALEERTSTSDDSAFLVALNRVWSEHCEQMVRLLLTFDELFRFAPSL